MRFVWWNIALNYNEAFMFLSTWDGEGKCVTCNYRDALYAYRYVVQASLPCRFLLLNLVRTSCVCSYPPLIKIIMALLSFIKLHWPFRILSGLLYFLLKQSVLWHTSQPPEPQFLIMLSLDINEFTVSSSGYINNAKNIHCSTNIEVHLLFSIMENILVLGLNKKLNALFYFLF